MTPTPDVPGDAATDTAAPLTAAQIAHLQRVANDLAFVDWSSSIAKDILALLASHAALRDRLARQEERIGELEGALESHRHTDECLRYAAQTGKSFCIAPCADAHRHALLAAPTDGAARAGDAE